MGLLGAIKKGYKKAKKGVSKVGKAIDKGIDKLEDLGDKAKEVGKYLNENEYTAALLDKGGSVIGVDNLSDKVEKAGRDFESQTDTIKATKDTLKSVYKKAKASFKDIIKDLDQEKF